MKIIWLTDPHILADGKTLLGHDTQLRLRTAVDYVTQYHADADCCVLSGDLTDHGDAESYRVVREILSSCPVKTFAIPGNHDNRAVMRQELAFPENLQAGFIQYAIVKDGQRIIFLDSLQENHAEGILCAQRLSWLDSELALHKELPTLVFCHHPPAKLHLPMMDQEHTQYGEKLLDRLCAAPNVKHLFFGHVHRPVSGSFRGLGFSALQSTAIQAPLPYPAWDWDSFSPAEEAPAIGIIHTSPESVVVHYHTFCKPMDGVLLA